MLAFEDQCLRRGYLSIRDCSGSSMSTWDGCQAEGTCAASSRRRRYHLEPADRLCARSDGLLSLDSGFLHKVQWHDHDLYDWFLRVGLTPAKSRTIAPLAVPDELFADFFRGCIDGDGSVLVYTDRYHAAKCPHYVYERLYVSLVSASRRFLAWIRESIRRATGLSGVIHNGGGRSQRSIWALRYAKAESIRLLGWMYYAPGIPCLARKRDKAVRFLAPLGYASARSVGRRRVGWLYTVPASGELE